MTTPEIDGSPSTVEGGDKPGANPVTTPVYDPTRPDCASCGEAWEDHLGRPFFHCPEQESNYVPLPSPAPVDAAPTKDPDEIEALVDALASRIYEQAVATDCAYVRFAAERTALLSAVASLRARAEEAEDDRYHLQGRLKEAYARYERVASSLERMREEYRRVKGALQCLDLGASNRNAYVEHAMLCDARFSNAPCECGYAEVEAIQRECSACPNEAHEDGLCDPCHGFSPSTPETKDDHR